MFYFAMKQPIDGTSTTEIVGNFNHVPVWANNQVYTSCYGVKADYYTSPNDDHIARTYYNHDRYRTFMQIDTGTGKTATFSNNYPGKLFWSTQEQEIDNVVPIPTKKIEGKWYIKKSTTPYNFPAFCGCELVFILQDRNGNNTQCSYITGVPAIDTTFRYLIKTTNTGYSSDLYPNAVYGDSFREDICDISFVTNYGSATSEDDLVNHVVKFTNLGSISSTYQGGYIIIDTPQDIPEIIYNWITTIATFVPEKKVIIKTADGLTTKATIKLPYDANGININQDPSVSTKVKCKIQSIAPGVYSSASWTPIKPSEYEEDLSFVGLANNPQQRKPDYKYGGTGYQKFSFPDDEKVLYECWNYPKPTPTGDLTLICYENKAEDNKLDKTDYLSVKLTMTGTLRAECDILKPVIEFTYAGTQVPSFNYVGIDYFRRYYFVDKMDIVRTGLYRLYLSVDELHTYKDEIMPCRARVVRTCGPGFTLYEDELQSYEPIPRKIVNGQTFSHPDQVEFLPTYGTEYNFNNAFMYCVQLFSSDLHIDTPSTYVTTQLNAFQPIIMSRSQMKQLCFNLKKDNINNIIDAVNSYFGDAPLEAINSVRLFPINLDKYFNLSTIPTQTLQVGKLLLDGSGSTYRTEGKYMSYAALQNARRLYGTIHLTDTQKKYLFDSRNRTAKLIITLPFVGNVPIDKTVLRNIDGELAIRIYTSLDLTTGNLTYTIYQMATSDTYFDLPILVETIPIGIDIPISKIDYNKQIGTAINSMSSVLGSAISLNTASVASAGVSAIAQIAESNPSKPSISTASMNYRSNIVSSWLEFTHNKSLQNPRVTVYYYDSYATAGYSQDYGYRTNETASISACKGPSKVSLVHLENMGPSITKTELENIERKLKEGFIA